MAFFESAVVVYLREIAYPGGFSLPIKALSSTLSTTEILREFFSLVMLFAVSSLIGKKSLERFGWFLYIFAVWDIFYYVFLKLILGWPASFFTTDILFLIPVVWTGPVLAPLLLTVLMILFSVLILNVTGKMRYLHLRLRELFLLILGSLTVVLSFTLDYFVKSQSNSLGNMKSSAYMPGNFNWFVFAAGYFLISWGILRFYFDNRKILKR
jgi:hypothetical protein